MTTKESEWKASYDRAVLERDELKELLEQRLEPARDLRDMFAAAALQGIFAGYYASQYNIVPAPDTAANEAYSCADAMMLARKTPDALADPKARK